MVILVMRCTFLLTNITVYMNESVLHVHDNEITFVISICVNLEMFMEHWN